MKICVRYPDGRTELVRPPLLTLLIERKGIQAFQRQSGWVTLGQDPIRQNGLAGYPGPERRKG